MILKKDTELFELLTRYDSAQSFYGKAQVAVEPDGTKILYSHDTEVAVIRNGVPVVADTYSNTTLRHIKEFLKLYGFKADTKAQILRDYAPREIAA